MLKIKPIEQHPAKRIFKKHSVSVAQVAQALELSFPYTCQLLSGAIRCTSENQKKLDELISSLKGKK